MFGIIASFFNIDILELKKPKDRFHHPHIHPLTHPRATNLEPTRVLRTIAE